MSDTPKIVTVTLSEPVKHNKTEYVELTFRKRKAKDLVAMDLVKGETRKHMAMIASMAGVPLQVIEELDSDDYEQIAVETVPLMGKSTRKAMEDRARQEPESPEPSEE